MLDNNAFYELFTTEVNTSGEALLSGAEEQSTLIGQMAL
jgi:hypothetical protein